MRPKQITWVHSTSEAPPLRRTYTTDKDWEKHKDTILHLRQKNVKLQEVIAILKRTKGFEASESQYKQRLKLWKDKRKFNKKQRRYMIQQIKIHDGRFPAFRYSGGEILPADRVQSVWDRRGREGEVPLDIVLTPDGIVVPSPTPSPRPPSPAMFLPPSIDWETDLGLTQNFPTPPWLQQTPQPSTTTMEDADGTPFNFWSIEFLKDFAFALLDQLGITLEYEYKDSDDNMPRSVVQAQESSAPRSDETGQVWKERMDAWVDAFIQEAKRRKNINLDRYFEETESDEDFEHETTWEDSRRLLCTSDKVKKHSGSPVTEDTDESEGSDDEVNDACTSDRARIHSGASNAEDTDESEVSDDELRDVYISNRGDEESVGDLSDQETRRQNVTDYDTDSEASSEASSEVDHELSSEADWETDSEAPSGDDIDKDPELVEAMSHLKVAASKYDEADFVATIEILRRPLDILQEKLGRNNHHWLGARLMLGRSLGHTHGGFEEATEVLADTARRYKRNLGPYNPVTRHVNRDLAYHCSIYSNFDMVWEPLLRAICCARFKRRSCYSKIFHSEHCDIIAVNALLPTIQAYESQGDYDRASYLALALFEERASIFQSKEENILAVLLALAAHLEDLDLEKPASILLLETKSFAEKELQLSPTHQLMLELKHTINRINLFSSKFDDCLELERQLGWDLSTWEKMFPQLQMGTRNRISNLVQFYEREANFGKFIQYQERELTLLEEMYGKDNRHSLGALQYITIVLSRMDLVLYARPISYYVLKVAKELYGPFRYSTVADVVASARQITNSISELEVIEL